MKGGTSDLPHGAHGGSVSRSHRCFCGRLLTPCEDGFRCAKCGRSYDSSATLPACKHANADNADGDMRECRECGIRWREVEEP